LEHRQPHVHVLVRGRSDDGQDLVIGRDYISNGFRGRAAERVTLELDHAASRIRAGLENEVGAERWTSLDPSAISRMMTEESSTYAQAAMAKIPSSVG
jgi:type IV secretory pathway VirD2 relaxase